MCEGDHVLGTQWKDTRYIVKKSKATQPHRRTRKGIIVVLALSVAGVLYWGMRGERGTVVPSNPAEPQPANTNQSLPNAGGVAKVPPYYESAEAARPFPELLPAGNFNNIPLVARAYRAAAEIPEVAAQQPCYCFCDTYGHKSLLDCYASDHAAG